MFAGGGSGTGHEFRAVNENELVLGLLFLFTMELMIVDMEQSGNDGTTTIPGMTHTLMCQSVSRDISNLTTTLLSQSEVTCSKYDRAYNCLVHNMNYVNLWADSDCTIDESTWGFSGYSGKCGG
jgi:hypothetical protein